MSSTPGGVRAWRRWRKYRACGWGEVRASDLAFRIGPRINAAGRLGSANVALNALMAKSPGQARVAADRLQHLNQRRRQMTSDAQADVDAQLEQLANETARACLGAAEVIVRLRPTVDAIGQAWQRRDVASPGLRAVAGWRSWRNANASRSQTPRGSGAFDKSPVSGGPRYAKRPSAQRVQCAPANHSQSADRPAHSGGQNPTSPRFSSPPQARISSPRGIAGLAAGTADGSALSPRGYRRARRKGMSGVLAAAFLSSTSRARWTTAPIWLARHGGHAQAAGFSVRRDNLPALRKQLERLASRRLRRRDSLAPALRLDARAGRA